MNLILLGAPGAGKGTQAELLTQKLSIPAISTGTMHRDTVQNGIYPGKDVQTYRDGGLRTSEQLLLDSVRKQGTQPDCDNGFIMDRVLSTLVHGPQTGYAEPVVFNPPTNEGICSHWSNQPMDDAGWDFFEAMGAVV